jgi:Amiloride-sensitive sodium channel
MMSGGLKQIMIIPGRKYFLSITPQINFGSPLMRDLDPFNRGCIFDDEKLPQFPANYPHNDCRFLCRHQYIVNLCNCYPFHYVNSYNRTHCTLKDLPCLNKAQDNWLNAEPPVSHNRIEKRLFQCPQCIAKCDSVRYMVQTSFSFFSPSELKDEIGSNYLIANETLDQLRTRNLLHFFFSDDFVFGNEQTLTYTWYDLLSKWT